jgi:hypothetical protein
MIKTWAEGAKEKIVGPMTDQHACIDTCPAQETSSDAMRGGRRLAS